MIKSTWAERLRKVGISQVDLARRRGVHANTVSRQLRAEDLSYTTLIEALEIMTPDQRKRWLAGGNAAMGEAEPDA